MKDLSAEEYRELYELEHKIRTETEEKYKELVEKHNALVERYNRLLTRFKEDKLKEIFEKASLIEGENEDSERH